MNAVTVRMYNVGFGDCFLIKIPGAGRVQKVLIDCGTIAAATISMPDIVDTLIQDVTDDDDVPRIDVVVGTHRHADHVSGFSDPRWKDVEVKEVWMPWTEDPKDPEAKFIRETQSRLALALKSVWTNRLAINDSDVNARQFLAVAENALSNAKAMTTLHKGFKKSPLKRFLCAPTTGLDALETRVFDGVTTYVLGPSKSVDIIRDMNPPAGKTYLKQFSFEEKREPLHTAFNPFGPEWTVTPADYNWGDIMLQPDEVELLKDFSDLADPALTVSLDKAVNGTSLVLVFEIGDAVLLFPGDAQWGTWNAILRDSEARELLSRVNFFKIGHHGSHNATPKEFVTNVLQNNCCAMMSTKAGKWASIPRQPLVSALEAKTRLARSDVTSGEEGPLFLRSASQVEATIAI